MGVGLVEQILGLLLEGLDRVGAGGPPPRRFGLPRKLDKCLGELAGVTALQAGHFLPVSRVLGGRKGTACRAVTPASSPRHLSNLRGKPNLRGGGPPAPTRSRPSRRRPRICSTRPTPIAHYRRRSRTTTPSKRLRLAPSNARGLTSARSWRRV